MFLSFNPIPIRGRRVSQAFNPRPENRVVALDEALTNFKLNPEVIDWHIPRYFRDDREKADEIEVLP